MTTRVMINGREFEIPEPYLNGEQIRALGNIEDHRLVILQRTSGNYLINSSQQYPLQDGDYFSDAPTFRYG
jgi:hypothetical protein